MKVLRSFSQSHLSHKNKKLQKDQPANIENQQVKEEIACSAQKILKLNFGHHDVNLCVCGDCVCGRHLCKLHPTVKPELSIQSTYKQRFNKKQCLPVIPTKHTECMKFQGPNLDMKSTYLHNFDGKSTQIDDRYHPVDELKIGGPTFNLTSYGANFPGHKCGNQYVKPKPDMKIGGLPFHGKTTYRSSFSNTKPAKLQTIQKINDNLKNNGGNLYGLSSYGNFFKKPNPQDYPIIRKIIDKHLIDPNNYQNQFTTTYKNEFLQKQSVVCPAKVKLQTKLKNLFNQSRHLFNPNTDFKPMAKDYHALSTSKLSII